MILLVHQTFCSIVILCHNNNGASIIFYINLKVSKENRNIRKNRKENWKRKELYVAQGEAQPGPSHLSPLSSSSRNSGHATMTEPACRRRTRSAVPLQCCSPVDKTAPQPPSNTRSHSL